MKIGIAKESKDHEFRVALTPEGVEIVLQTSTYALTQAPLPFIVRLANGGVEAALRDPGMARGVNVRHGEITYPAVAEAHGLPCEPPVRKE